MPKKSKFQIQNILKTLGPGLLFAGAAIGGSHLVQSTRAGADYGFLLIGIVLLANFLKYPFFEYGHRYAALTGKSLLNGYYQLGRPVLLLFFILNFVTAPVITAAVTMVCAGIAGQVIGLGLSIKAWSAVLFVMTIALLIFGGYRWLDKSVKFIIVLLALSTVVAVLMAIGKGPAGSIDAQAPSIWSFAGLSFLLALLGWMPAPIEASAWSSLWVIERKKETGHEPTHAETAFDFNLGYVGTALLAACFLSLGALVMFGTGETFSASGIVFAGQVIGLYAKSLGEWSIPIISIAALTTMLSTTLTVADAYPRVIAGALSLFFPNLKKREVKIYQALLFFLCLFSFAVILWMASSMRALIDFATVMSFLLAPVFAYINLRVVTDGHVPKACIPGKKMRILSWTGIVFLAGISLVYVAWKWFL